eukprot:m.44377 g.44377  ORF g.44377 m.44377 type:complete len:295 (+) comp6516_c0_seq1:238-1122(+)
MSAAIDTQNWDLDFFHLPFESDLPEDILACVHGQERDSTDDYSTSILTPPLSTSTAVEDHFAFEQHIGTDYLLENNTTSVTTNALFGTTGDAEYPFAAANWATPPASPPPAVSATLARPSPASRFSFAFKPELYQAYSTPAESSAEDESDDWSVERPRVATTTPVRRRSSTGATKARRASKGAVAAAIVAMTPSRGSPVPPDSPSSDDELDEPESKRKSHNVLERKRRNDLKKSYQELRLQLPNLAENSRAPTGHILTKAVEFIEQLKAEEVTRLRVIDELRRRNQRLRSAAQF